MVAIEQIELFVKNILAHDTTGHDWYHIDRVRKMAVQIAKDEQANLRTVEVAALLHDVIDDKLIDNKEAVKKEIQALLLDNGFESESVTEILYIIENIGYKGGTGIKMDLLEGRIIQDADRLDALGAIGVARTFMYSGAKGQAMYDPNIAVRESMSYEQYRHEKSTAINHFHEKLLKLRETLHTDGAKKIAEDRHQFLQQFLAQFYKEWDVTL